MYSYVGDGKIPNNEMMKLTHKYGWKFVCGWLPPTDVTACGFMLESVVSCMYSSALPLCPRTLFDGFESCETFVEASIGWV